MKALKQSSYMCFFFIFTPGNLLEKVSNLCVLFPQNPGSAISYSWTDITTSMTTNDLNLHVPGEKVHSSLRGLKCNMAMCV